MTVQLLEQIADDLDKAAVSARPIEQITKRWAISLDDAYRVQDMVVERRLKRGETRRGFGLAFSSRAKMKQFGLSDQIYGCITSGMEIADGGLLHLEKLIQPRVEPEVAFILGKDVSEPLPVFELMRSVEAIAVTLDIIDSYPERFRVEIGVDVRVIELDVADHRNVRQILQELRGLVEVGAIVFVAFDHEGLALADPVAGAVSTEIARDAAD
jgi:2-oxo-3-hexenedioate decarboxylase